MGPVLNYPGHGKLIVRKELAEKAAGGSGVLQQCLSLATGFKEGMPQGKLSFPGPGEARVQSPAMPRGGAQADGVHYVRRLEIPTANQHAAAAAAKSVQSCLTLCDPIDSGLPGSPVPGILQA